MSIRASLLVTLCLARAGFAAEERPRLEPARAVSRRPSTACSTTRPGRARRSPLTEWLTYNPLNGEKLAAADGGARGLRRPLPLLRLPLPRSRAGQGAQHHQPPRQHVQRRLGGLEPRLRGQRPELVRPLRQPVRHPGRHPRPRPARARTRAPDWVWDSAGTAHRRGLRRRGPLPLTSIRFKSGAEVRMGVLFWRRVSRLGISASWPTVPAGRSFIERTPSLVLHDLKRPLTLELTPSATYSRRQTRATPDGVRARGLRAGRRALRQVRPDVGGHRSRARSTPTSARWRATPSRSRSTSASRSSSPRSAPSSWRAWAASSWRAWAATPSCAPPSTPAASWTRSGA